MANMRKNLYSESYTAEHDRHLAHFKSFIAKIASIDPEAVEALAARAKLRHFSKGEIFVREGNVCRELLYIHSGVFRYYITHDGREINKDFAFAGNNPFCTAFSSFVNDAPSEIWIDSLLPCEAWVWRAGEVKTLFNSELPWILFAKKMAEQLYFRKEQRELSFLKLSGAERYRQFRRNFPGLEQQIPQFHIASYLGLTAESLSRIRAHAMRQ